MAQADVCVPQARHGAPHKQCCVCASNGIHVPEVFPGVLTSSYRVSENARFSPQNTDKALDYKRKEKRSNKVHVLEVLLREPILAEHQSDQLVALLKQKILTWSARCFPLLVWQTHPVKEGACSNLGS